MVHTKAFTQSIWTRRQFTTYTPRIKSSSSSHTVNFSSILIKLVKQLARADMQHNFRLGIPMYCLNIRYRYFIEHCRNALVTMLQQRRCLR